jgi:hypothetical protein
MILHLPHGRKKTFPQAHSSHSTRVVSDYPRGITSAGLELSQINDHYPRSMINGRAQVGYSSARSAENEMRSNHEFWTLRIL